MNRTSMDCHRIEDVPGLYIDAFQSEFLRTINNNYNNSHHRHSQEEDECCDTGGDAAAAAAAAVASGVASDMKRENNNKRREGRVQGQHHHHRCEHHSHRCCLILTHYHSDHYQNLPRGGDRGNNAYGGPIPIHCTPVTASLLVKVHGVPSHLVVAHEYGQRWTYKYNIKSSKDEDESKKECESNDEKKNDDDDDDDDDEVDEEVFITFYDANHCPGAAIVVVEMPPSSNEKESNRKKRIHIHTGDMRYHPKMKSYPLLMKKSNANEDKDIVEFDVDVLYLDTTYGRPKHTFQTQEDAIDKIASQVEQCLLPLPEQDQYQGQGQDKQNDHDDNNEKNEEDQQNDHDDETKAEVKEQQQQQQQKHNSKKKEKKTLVLLSCYSIGKEKVLWECSKRTNQLVYVSEKKLRMMECIITQRQTNTGTSIKASSTFTSSSASQIITADENNVLEDDDGDDDDDDNLLPCHRLVERCTRDSHKTPIHVVPMGLAGEMWPYFQPNYRNCVDYYEDMVDAGTTTTASRTSPETEAAGTSQQQTTNYDRIVAFIPTGWADGSNWNKKNAVSSRRVQCRKDPNKYIDVEIRLISYSEHSSMTELEEFVRYLRPRKIIPTVFKDKNDRRRLENLFTKYVDTSRAKLHFFKGMISSSSPSLANGNMNAGMFKTAATKSRIGDGTFSIGLKTSTQGIRNKMVNNYHTASSSSTMKKSPMNESIESHERTVVDLTGSSDEEGEGVKGSKRSDGDRLSLSTSEDRSFSNSTRPLEEGGKNESSRQNGNLLTSMELESLPKISIARPKQKPSPSGKRKHTLITQFFSTKKKTKNENNS